MKKLPFSAIIAIFANIICSNSAKCQEVAAKNSVLSSGKWIKIGIEKSGVYKISYQKLRELGFSNPENVRVFGNDFGMLPFMNNESVPDDLIENSILKTEKAIYFYSQGPNIWSFSDDEDMYLPKNHLFTTTSYYFLTDLNTGKDNNIKKSEILQSTISQSISEGIMYYCHEKDLVNLQLSGREWFGENFFYETTHKITFDCNNIPNSGKIKVSTIARSSTSNSYTFSIGDTQESASCNYVTTKGLYADRQTKTFNYKPENSDRQTITITFNKKSAAAEGYLDYVILNTRENLKYKSKQLIFSNINTSNKETKEFKIENNKKEISVWDVTNSISPILLTSRVSDNYTTFNSETQNNNTYVIFSESDVYEPTWLKNDEQNIANQNLHSLETPEYLIITTSKYIKYAQEIKAIHSELKTEIATTEEIYNEFSGGNQDISAIRNFIKFLYNKSKKLKYVFLFGDGSVDNISNSSNNSNVILTYQSPNSLNENNLNSFVTDDYFGLLDENEGEYFGKLDIGIGRWPIKNEVEAQVAVEKIKTYQSKNYERNWKKNICFVADDENRNLHNQQADYQAQNLENEHGEYNISKIYIDSYKQESSAAVNTYPEAREQLIKTINNGINILHYTGHGGMKYFADERILTINDINSLSNKEKLPIFITASCNIGHFDYFNRTNNENIDSPAERFLHNKNGGAIAMFTTTREVLASENFVISQNILKHIFEPDNRFGDVIKLAKNETSDNNKLNFTLLGDPACKLSFPEFQIEVSKINKKDISESQDTLKALGKYEIECKISETNNFNGTAYISLFDKQKNKSTLNNDGDGIFDYQEYDTKIYEGKSTIQDGKFKFEFVVPKDIDYNVGFGKLSLYAENQEVSAIGFSKSIKIGSCDTISSNDKIGPEIKLYLDNLDFENGGKTGKHPTLIAILSDSSGINITNANNKHNISLTIDNSSTTISLTDYYKQDQDSYKSGRIEYKLQELSEGSHKLKLKAWDNYNNSNEKEIEFVVSNNDKLQISHLLNYPNPFTDKTKFYFEHNNPGSIISYELSIYTITGSIVKVLTGSFCNNQNLSEPIEWDGKDEFGNKIGKGVYFYRLKIKDLENRKATAFEKLLYLN